MRKALALAAFALIACDEQVRVYAMVRIDPPVNGKQWLVGNTRTYRIGSDYVVEEWAGGDLGVLKHENCAVFDAHNWSCPERWGYSFGMQKGDFFFRNPDGSPSNPDEMKYVSSLEWNLLRCQWAFSEPSEAWFWRAVRCVWYWE
jgi:hypothetical protein